MTGDWLQFFVDFNQGFGSLLSVRGQGILSWTGDDNFVVEDRATASHEVCPHISFHYASFAKCELSIQEIKHKSW